MELYHGSDRLLDAPRMGGGIATNDYGPGFYCTENLALAYEWACTDRYTGFANKYELDTTGLSILNLNGKNFHILNWLAVLLQNRRFDIGADLPRQIKDYILGHYLPDYADCDIIIGYRADDSYFSYARAFLNNTISLEQLNRAMRLGKLGEQVVIRSAAAYDALFYLSGAPADRNTYYPRRLARDKAAREGFLAMRGENNPEDAVYAVDILRQKWQNDDPRLR